MTDLLYWLLQLHTTQFNFTRVMICGQAVSYEW